MLLLRANANDRVMIQFDSGGLICKLLSSLFLNLFVLIEKIIIFFIRENPKFTKKNFKFNFNSYIITMREWEFHLDYPCEGERQYHLITKLLIEERDSTLQKYHLRSIWCHVCLVFAYSVFCWLIFKCAKVCLYFEKN